MVSFCVLSTAAHFGVRSSTHMVTLTVIEKVAGSKRHIRHLLFVQKVRCRKRSLIPVAEVLDSPVFLPAMLLGS
jgi:hypothetical protein